jgi:aminoglycoside phosphotransferase (APT) family kinase protein
LSSLPPAARRWLAALDVTPTVVRRLPGTTAALFAFDDHVLRWYEGGTFLDVEPDAVVREVAALTALAGTPVPGPGIVAWSRDPAAVLMTLLPGEHRLDAAGGSAVGAVLDAIHAVDPVPFAAWSYRGYHEGGDLPRPRWWRDGRLWDRALASSAARPTTVEPVVIHRDFHPGNVLWVGSAISGVVDWGNACLGPAEFDLAHYRVNLATLVGPELTDERFPGDPTWDIEAALGFIDPWDPAAVHAWQGPWPHLPAAEARVRVEAFVSRAVGSLR